MKRVRIRETGPLALEMTLRGGKKERLAITDPFYPNTVLSNALFRSLGTMQLVAPYLPEVIDTDLEIDYHIASTLISGMYESCGERPPRITGTVESPRRHPEGILENRAVVSYSAGKDSLHSMMRAQDSWGHENVLAAHIGGLNTSNASGERKYAYRQAERLGFGHFRNVDLMSSGKCTKNRFEVMRSRDMFMTGILVPIALQFGSSRIITEGFEEATPAEPYTGQERNMKKFNSVLSRMRIPVQVSWYNLPEMDVIRELYKLRPRWMPEVHNCFSIECYKPGIRRSWVKRAPSFTMYESQCGSCVKCRIVNIGRIHYDKELLADASFEDIAYYLKETVSWLRKKHETHRDMIQGSFIRELCRALRKFGLEKQQDRIPVEVLCPIAPAA